MDNKNNAENKKLATNLLLNNTVFVNLPLIIGGIESTTPFASNIIG